MLPAIRSSIRASARPAIGGVRGGGVAPLVDTLVPADPTEWNQNGVNTTITPLGGNVWRVEMPVGGGTFLAHFVPLAGTPLTLSFRVRSRTGSYSIRYRFANDVGGTAASLNVVLPITTDWQDVTNDFTAGIENDTLSIVDDGTTNADIEIADIRLVSR
jgi:hypothetical protein